VEETMTAVQHHPDLDVLVEQDIVTHSIARRALAVLRIAFGVTFLWAFFDKLLALGYATGKNAETGAVDRFGPDAWINEGSPTFGFLNFGVSEDNWFHGFFTGIAGDAWADWLFMIGLLAIGIALIFGIGLRIAAVSGTLMMLGMWAAEWPLAKFTSAGEPSMSTNPIVDYHIIYALALIALAVTYAGHTWGLGRLWARLPFVQRNRWLI
jgi:thiosulfate dehydrogenase [quinone] large subunit